MKEEDVVVGVKVRYVGRQKELIGKTGFIVTKFPVVKFDGETAWGVSLDEIELIPYNTRKVVDILNED